MTLIDYIVCIAMKFSCLVRHFKILHSKDIIFLAIFRYLQQNQWFLDSFTTCYIFSGNCALPLCGSGAQNIIF